MNGKKRRTPEYAAWADMVQRCTNPKNRGWARYGGRGIEVCDRWRENFEAFAADMGPRPDGHSLDRIDNDGPYSPENCRWSTEKRQQRNKRNNRGLTIGGETMCIAAWAERAGLPRYLVASRLRSGWAPAVAVSAPVGARKLPSHAKAGIEPAERARPWSSSGYRGVHRSGRGWGAVINVDGRQRWLGTYRSREDAARAYDRAALEHFGDDAVLNFAEAS